MKQPRDNASQIVDRLIGALLYALHVLPAFTVAILGSVALWLALRANLSDYWQTILQNMGAALVVAGIASLVIEAYTRRSFAAIIEMEMKRILESSSLSSNLVSHDHKMTDDHKGLRDLISFGQDLRSLGIRRVHRDRNSTNMDAHLKAAAASNPAIALDKNLRFLGVALKHFDDTDAQNTLIDCVKAGWHVKLLALDPESQYIKYRANQEDRTDSEVGIDVGSTNKIIANFILKSVPRACPRSTGSIELSIYDAPPDQFMISTATTVLVGPYLRGIRGEESPHLELEVRANGIHEAFIKHFDTLWEKAQCAACWSGLEL